LEYKNLLRKMLPFSLKATLTFLMPVLFLLLGIQTSRASHFMGGDISYVCLGNNQYQVFLTIYRDCSGVGMSTSELLTINSPSCGLTLPSVTATQVAGTGNEVSPVCAALLPQTTCNSGGTLPGVQEYVYSAIITLPQGCRDWRVSWGQCCRNNATNLQNATSQNFFITSTINNLNGLCNNSATFTALPVPYICAGQPFNYNHGAIDADGDSLIYELIQPASSATVNIPYQGTFTPQQPLLTSPPNSLVFNTFTGQMSFTPQAGTVQTVVMAVRVYEIRNGDTIGITMRDMQVVVLTNCTNSSVSGSAPIVSAGGTFDPVTRSFVVCQCTDLDFVIHASDPDGDTLTLDPNLSNIGTVFGPGNVILFPVYPIPGRRDTLDLYVRIRTCDAPLGVNGFTLVITDNACPIPLPVYLGFNVIIPGVNVTASDTAVCAGIAQTIQLGAQTFSTSNAAVAGTFSWSQISGPASVISNDTIANPTLSIPGTTLPGQQVVLVVEFSTTPDPISGASCVTTDTLVVSLVNLPLNLTVAASDSSLCQNGFPNAINFNTTVSGPGVDLANGIYSWTTFPPARIADLSSTSVNNPIGQIAGTPGDSAFYIVQYQYGACVGRDTVELYFNPGSVIVTPAIDTICPGDTIQLNAVLSDTFVTYNPVCDDYTLQSIAFSPIAGTGISAGVQCDDCVSAALPIGFNFDFYCTTYSQFRASSNGFISFDPAPGSGCCTGQLLPNASAPNNLIALIWEDLNPSSCGTVTYFSTGTAPNRRLCVNFNNVCFFGSTTNTVNGQIVLHETTNIIDLFISPMTPPGTFDLMTMGIESQGGLFARTVPGRNNANFSIPTAEGWRFTPVPNAIFEPISYNWTPNIQMSNDTIRNPFVYPAGDITYYIDISEGNCVMRDSVQIFVNSTIPAPTVSCGNPVNYPTEIQFEWGGSTGATGWAYSVDSGANFVSVPLAVDSLLLTGFTDGDCFQIQVRAEGPSGLCPTNAATLFSCCTTPCINPTQISSTASTDLSCFESGNGTITYLASQGDLGPNYTLTLLDASNGQLVQGPQTSATGTVTFNNLSIGSYYVTGTDAFGCLATSDTVTLTQPIALDASLAATTLTSCWNTSDGSATVTQVGGTAPYTYAWSDLAAQTTVTATGLSLGAYFAIVTDANGCMDTVSNINVFGPFAQAPFVSMVVTPSTGCPGNGSATIQSVQSMAGNPIPGTAGSLSYVWGSATGVIATDVISINNLLAGIYYLTVTDTSGCVFIDTFTVAGAQIDISNTVVNNPDCNQTNGSISLTVVGDPLGYNFVWNTGASTQNLSGLGAGNYTVTVTGIGGCVDSASFNLIGGGIQAVVSSLDERVCPGEQTGFINIDTSSFGGGTVSFLWSNGATTQNISGLGAGSYSLTVTYNGSLACVANPVATILEPNAFIANATVVNCGTVQAAPSGGWATSYSYAWSNGDTTAQLSDVAPGTYYVTVTDGEGCTSVDSVSFSVPFLDAYIGTVPGITIDTLTLGLTTPMSAGVGTPVPGVSYNWTPAANVFTANLAQTVSAEILVEGTYDFIITANNGVCELSDTVTLVLQELQFTGLPEAFSPDGDGVNDFFRPTPYPTTNIEILDFYIINRWGQIVFKAENQQEAIDGWDGNYNGAPQPRDVYIYVFSYRIPGDPNIRTLRSQVYLMR
jgi:gliding motility-associated-like protein